MWNGYQITDEQIAATCKLYFAQRRGQRYVIKEYINYRFQEGEKGDSPAQRRAEVFYAHLRKLARVTRARCRTDGLLNIPVDVFRRGSMIYKVSREVEDCRLEPGELLRILQQDAGTASVFFKTILLQLEKLEKLGYVHCDIKPDNLVVVKQGRYYAASFIDFEGGFFLGEPRQGRHIEYTPEYASPEMIRFQEACLDEKVDEAAAEELFRKLGTAVDVFALGCVFAEYLTAEPPGATAADGSYCAPGYLIQSGVPFRTPRTHPVWRSLLSAMLSPDPARRPAAAEVLSVLEAAEQSGVMTRLRKDANEPGWCPSAGTGGSWVQLREAECGAYMVEVVQHLPGVWPLFCTGSKNVRLWSALVDGAQRCLDRADQVLETVRGCAEELAECSGMTVDVRLKTVGELSVCIEQRFSSQEKVIHNPGDGVQYTASKADRLLLQLLAAAEVLHRSGLLFGALAKEDVWIGKLTRGKYQMQLTGLHRLWRREQLPRPEDVDGTPELCAPEVAFYLSGSDELDSEELAGMIGPWSDIFSIGLIYHLLLCGRLPSISENFPGAVYPSTAAFEDEEGVSGLILDGSIDSLRRGVLRQMLRFWPEERFQSCEEAARVVRSCRKKRGKKQGPSAQDEGDSAAVIINGVEQQWVDGDGSDAW